MEPLLSETARSRNARPSSPDLAEVAGVHGPPDTHLGDEIDAEAPPTVSRACSISASMSAARAFPSVDDEIRVLSEMRAPPIHGP